LCRSTSLILKVVLYGSTSSSVKATEAKWA
jgi:hypothetical protein